MGNTTPKDVMAFWFGTPAADARELGIKMRRWFQGGPQLDAEVKERFGDVVEDAIAGRLDAWLDQPDGLMALIIVLDQFTRNVLRDQPRMYDGDARAQRLAEDALKDGRIDALPLEERQFASMPLTHSENVEHQKLSVAAIQRVVDAAPDPLKPIYAMGIEQTRKYLDVISRFGRFPHRNRILGRESTPEEVEFLRDWAAKQPPSEADKLMGPR